MVFRKKKLHHYFILRIIQKKKHKTIGFSKIVVSVIKLFEKIFFFQNVSIFYGQYDDFLKKYKPLYYVSIQKNYAKA